MMEANAGSVPSPAAAGTTPAVPVLSIDRELCEELEPERCREAERSCLAVVEVVHGPRLVLTPALAQGASGFGLLVLEGILCRRIGDGARVSAELVGPGDVLRPWEPVVADWASIDVSSDWKVLEGARLAVLDRRFAYRAARFPEIGIALMRRSLRRTSQLALLMEVANRPRVESRLEMLFRHLGDRFGKVRPDGIEIRLRLTHALLAELVGARRPSVSSALTRLRAEGVIVAGDGCWLLPHPGRSA